MEHSAIQVSPEETSSGALVPNSRRTISPLSPLVYRTEQDARLIIELSTQCHRFRTLADESAASDKACRQQLQREWTAHGVTREELQREKSLRVNFAEASTCLRQEVFRLQQALTEEQEHNQQMTAELDQLRTWCYRVDSLVDVMRMEEDSKLDVNDRSRQIADIIIDIETKVESEQRARLQERDDRITELQLQLDQNIRVPAEPTQTKRRRIARGRSRGRNGRERDGKAGRIEELAE
ncbi:hypothetical protein ACJ73_03092 [Blastomyces percursus]|uniref:Uncharacterized protein n=1 Tax=Blastomyces percursus TaxID=1658174 RepID=A0A1J9QZD4_9EURO|nr:hypothetical protein ACJ73_03092 [Blastomyces percursus]